jgi:hypothetical protein
MSAPTVPSANVIRFPPRHAHCVFLLRDGSAWLVTAYGHGWIHGSSAAADADAQWMSRNLDLPIREATQAHKEIEL